MAPAGQELPHGGVTVGDDVGGGVGDFVGSGDFVGDRETEGCVDGTSDILGASDLVGLDVGTVSSRAIGSLIKSTAHL